jgi:branched-chain amino acid transport system permease protein
MPLGANSALIPEHGRSTAGRSGGPHVPAGPNDSMITWPNFVSQLFNGLASGALLALISAGLTIIYGTLGVLNLAHGAMFMLGGYAGWVAFQATGSFAIAVGAGALSLLALGAVVELVVIRHFYGRSPEDQLLVTFGLGIVVVELVRLAFGSLSLSMPPPAWAAGVTPIGFLIYPTYRIVVAGIAAAALAVLYVVLYRTRLGLVVRAGIEDGTMVGMLGINVYRVFMLVFGIGAMAAGFAGIVNAPVVSLTPDMGESILVQAFVVVVIGGVGSFPGAILGGLIAGEILSLTSMVDPAYSEVMLFAVMTLVLLLRPQGLLGLPGRE